MLKIVKLSQNLINHWFVRYSSSWRHQFKIEKPVYYPRRSLSEEDKLQIPIKEPEKSVGLWRKTVDYYKILGVTKNATAQEIKTAFYDLAKKYHPDAKPTPKETESFRKMSEAYKILSDANIRSEYDRNGMVVTNGQPSTKSIVQQNKKNFLRLFNEHPRAINNENRMALIGTAQKSEINEMELRLKFLQAVQGSTEYVDLKAMAKCTRCNEATRMGNQTNIEFCPKCGGTGQYRFKTASYTEHKKCDTCDGRRYINNKNICKTCENRGYLVQTKRVEVNVPAGTNDGDILKINHPLTNQVVAIRVSVEKSSHFSRDGNNISSDKYLTISQAMLGGKCKIRGLYEEFEVNLGPGTESHTMQCFKGKGIRTRMGHAGDHVVTFKIRIPKSLTTKQRQLVLALSRAEDPIFDGQ